MLIQSFTVFCLATSGSVSLTVATTSTQYSTTQTNEAASRQYQVSVSLIPLFVTYFHFLVYHFQSVDFKNSKTSALSL